jgi:DNA invertase Pin-like site-specific DNA recombinase
MSDDKQENSIDRQRSQVQPMSVREGYTIIREYIDEGIAGDEEKKREAFMRMLRDAERKDFKAILCDDKDRFGRFDSITQGYYVKPLRDAGIKLVTCAQGAVDWSSFAGRITDAVLQEAKKLESQATSRRVITLMLMMAQKGKWLGGPVPYGYDLENDPDLGKKLVLGDPKKVRVVKLIFRLYADQGFTLDMIARELYERGVLNPSGGPTWNKTTIRAILRNRKYVGDMTWNTGHDGKYSEFAGGLVRTADSRIPKRNNNPASDWVVLPDVHAAIIDRDLFERAQRKLAENKSKTTPLPKGGDYLLAGLLVCADCGFRMIGYRSHQGTRFYKCGRYHHEGKHACHANYIKEEKVLSCIVRKLQETILNPDNLEQLRAEVRRQQEEAARTRPAVAKNLRDLIADMDRDIDKGCRCLLALDEKDQDIFPDLAAELRAMKEERSRLAKQLVRLEAEASRGPAIEAVLQAVEKHLWSFREAVAEADPLEVRAVLKEYVSKVELRFTHVKRPKTTRSHFQKGLIFLRPQEGAELSELLNAASPIPDD